MITYAANPPAVAGARPISRENLLSKLCFVRFGGGLEAYRERLKTDLEHYLRQMSEPCVSRPTIFNWIIKGSVPTRKTGLHFLHQYMVESIEYKSLSDNQKKVYSQIERYFPEGTKNPNNERHLIGKIELPIAKENLKSRLNIDSEIGTYTVYRTTFSDAAAKRYSIELFNVYRSGRELKFRCWFKIDKTETGKFDGSVVILGNYVWFIGTSDDRRGRMRVLMTRCEDANFGSSQRYKWGVMLGDIPYAGTREPAACRVLMQRASAGSDLTSLVAKTVKLADQTDLIQQIGWAKTDVITRLVDNQLSAFSIPGGVSPALDEACEPVRDQVLTVDSRTLQSAVAVLSSHDAGTD